VCTALRYIKQCHTNALQPGLGSFPGRSERLVLGRAAAHTDFDSRRNERAVTEAGWWVIAYRSGRGIGQRQDFFTGGSRRLIAGSTHVRDAHKPNSRRTFRFLDEVESGMNVL